MTFCRFSGVPPSRFCGLYVFLLEDFERTQGGDPRRQQLARRRWDATGGKGAVSPALRVRQMALTPEAQTVRPHQTAWLSPDWTDQASPEEIAIHGGPEAEEWLRRRPLSGAIAVGMARLGGLDAEYRSKRNATSALLPWGPGTISTNGYGTDKRSFAGVASVHWSLRAGHWHKGRAGGLGPAGPTQSPATGNRPPGKCELSSPRRYRRLCLPRLNQACPNLNKLEELPGFA